MMSPMHQGLLHERVTGSRRRNGVQSGVGAASVAHIAHGELYDVTHEGVVIDHPPDLLRHC